MQPPAGALSISRRCCIRRPGGTPAFYGIAIGGAGALFSGNSGRNRQGEWNVVETLAVNRAAHALRLGADYERMTPTRESAALAVTGTWNSLSEVLAGRQPTIATTRADQASGIIETLSLFAQDTWKVSRRLTLTYGLRWELTPPPAVREPSALSAPQAGGAIGSPSSPSPPGVLFPPVPVPTLPGPALPSTPPAQALWKTSHTQFAPRLGGALRLDSRSVLRAGFGLFYDLGFSIALDPINGFPFNRWQFSAVGAAPTATDTALGARVAPGLALPYVWQWNTAYERAFGLRDIISISYVGSAGHRLLRREGVLQPNSRLAQSSVATNHGWSKYQGLEVQYRRRFGRGLQGTAAYSWAHAIDNGSWDSGLYLSDPRLPRTSDRGSSSFDVRHNFTAGFSFAPPWSSWLGRNWELSGMLRARSGFPIDPMTSENLLGLGFDDITRPDLLPGVPIWLNDSTIGGRRLNPAAFVTPAGLQGDLGRNAITGAGMVQLDMAVERVVPVWRGANLALRVEAFNALNHPNAADPARFLDSPFFGRPVSMLNSMLGTGSARSGLTPAFQIGGPRSLQVTLRLRF